MTDAPGRRVLPRPLKRSAVRRREEDADSGNGSGIDGAERQMLELQHSAGNRAVAAYLAGAARAPNLLPHPSVQRDPLPSEASIEDLSIPQGTGPAHPLLKWGKKGPDVLELQTKLNLVGANPQLVVDGIFGPKTAVAVQEFQLAQGLMADAIAGINTWTTLDALILGPTATTTTTGTGGATDTAGAGTEPGSPTATGVGSVDTGEGEPQAIATGSIHPVLRPGDSGPAASELQHKLNIFNFLIQPVVPITGVYDPLTVAAVLLFRAQQGVVENANIALSDVGPKTWAELDRVSPATPVGRVEKPWSELVAGQKASMVSRYTYRITSVPNQIEIEVRLGFSGDLSFVTQLLNDIKLTWNHFAAERTDDAEPHEQVPIVFKPVFVSAGADNSVQLLHSPNPDKPERSDASHWFIDDKNRLSYLAAHEFGHMIGLEDEYQRAHGDFTRVVGEPPAGAPLPGAQTAAAQLRQALFLPPDATPVPLIGPIIDLFRTPEENRAVEARRVVDNWGLAKNRRGAFDVALAYDSAFGPAAGGPDVITAIQQQLPSKRQLEFINVFTSTSGSTMGVPATMNADSDGSAHQHPLNARHLRQFTKFVQDFRGGTWVSKQVS